MGTKKFDFFFSKKFEIEFDLYFDLCWRAEIIQVGLNMHLYVDIGDASSSLWGSTSSLLLQSPVIIIMEIIIMDYVIIMEIIIMDYVIIMENINFNLWQIQ